MTEEVQNNQPMSDVPVAPSSVHLETPIEKLIEEEKDEIVSSLMLTNAGSLQLHKKQPIVWRCFNPHCRPDPHRPTIPFDFVSDEAKCPKCTLGPPMVVKRALVHLLVNVPDGKIVGDLGVRYRIACDKNRAYVTDGRDGEAGTGDVRQVNCPACIKEVQERLVRFGMSLKVEG